MLVKRDLDTTEFYWDHKLGPHVIDHRLADFNSVDDHVLDLLQQSKFAFENPNFEFSEHLSLLGGLHLLGVRLLYDFIFNRFRLVFEE